MRGIVGIPQKAVNKRNRREFVEGDEGNVRLSNTVSKFVQQQQQQQQQEVVVA
jgi:hypothetical protein